MSDVERYWAAVRAKCNPMPPEWHELNPLHQHQIVQSINIIMNVIQESSK